MDDPASPSAWLQLPKSGGCVCVYTPWCDTRTAYDVCLTTRDPIDRKFNIGNYLFVSYFFPPSRSLSLSSIRTPQKSEKQRCAAHQTARKIRLLYVLFTVRPRRCRRRQNDIIITHRARLCVCNNNT